MLKNEDFTQYINEDGLYNPPDLSFVNTSLINETARAYEANGGVYTRAPETSSEYKEFWDIEEERLLNGIVVPGRLEKGAIKKIWIPPALYAFLNYGRMRKIIFNKDDVTDELEFAFKLTKGKIKGATKIEGFPDFWDGHYDLSMSKYVAKQLGLHFIGAKSRRKGFSYYEAMEGSHLFMMKRKGRVFLTAYEKKYLIGGDRIANFSKTYIDWFYDNTDFYRGYLKSDINEFLKSGYRLRTSKEIERGYQSILMPITLKDNPDAPRGLDGDLVKFEEVQTFPNFLDVLKVVNPLLKDGAIMTGQWSAWGTGGDTTKETNWAPFETVYYNPKDWNCLAFLNKYDDNALQDKDGCGFMFPNYRNLVPFIDKNGNSLLEPAKEFDEKLRLKVKESAKTEKDYIDYTSEYANKPSEIFINSSTGILPDTSLQIQRQKNDPSYKNAYKDGRIVLKDGILQFVPNDLLPLENRHDFVDMFPLTKKIDLEGCVRFWQLPFRDPITGKVPDNLYRLWHDPYGVDKDTKEITIKDSIACTYIYERANNFTPSRGDVIIGAYHGRPGSMDTYNYQLLLLTIFCNGKLFFENDRGDVEGFFKRKKALHLLEDQPSFRYNDDIAGKPSNRKGVSMNFTGRKANALIYLRDWLNTIRGYDDFNNPITNLDVFPDIGGLREIGKYKKGNFDRVSTLLVGMLDEKEQESLGIVPKQPKVSTNRTNDFFKDRLFAGKMFN